MKRCAHMMAPGLCVMPTCEHFDGQNPNHKNLSTLARRSKGRPDRKRVEGRHTNFVDLTGQVFGPWTVLSEAPSTHGNSRWNVQHSCESKTVHVLGTAQLRSEKQRPRFCKACRPKPPVRKPAVRDADWTPARFDANGRMLPPGRAGHVRRVQA